MSLVILPRFASVARDSALRFGFDPTPTPPWSLIDEVDYRARRERLVIRGDDRDDLAVVLGEKDEALAAQNLLWEVNERIGHLGGRYDAKRVAIIVRPGDKWAPGMGEQCEHPWIERWVLSGRERCWCTCGVEFKSISDPEGDASHPAATADDAS